MSDFFATPASQRQALLDAALAPPSLDETQVVTGELPTQWYQGPTVAGVPVQAGVDWALENQIDADLRQGAARIGLGAARLGIQAGRLAEDIGSDVVTLGDTSALERQQVARDNWWENFLTRGERYFADTVRNNTVDPSTRSEAANLIGGVVNGLTTFMGSAVVGNVPGAAVAGVGFGRERQLSLEEQGLTSGQAFEGAVIEGTGMSAMALLPVSLPGRFWQRVASGAALNAGAGMATRYSMQSYLQSIGRDDLAEQYAWLEPRAVLTDVLIGSLFAGALGSRGEAIHPVHPLELTEADAGEPAPTREQEAQARDIGAAALVERGAIQDETAFGVPANQASRRWQSEALARADEQIARDEPLDPGVVPEGVEFIPLPEADQEIAFRAFAEHLAEQGVAPEDVNARLEQLRREGAARNIDPDMLYSQNARRVGAREDGGPLRNERLVVPDGVRLTPMEYKVAEMAHNGARRAWIAEEMDSTPNSVGVLLNKAKRKYEVAGREAPWSPEPVGNQGGTDPNSGQETATIAELVALRDRLLSQGFIVPPRGRERVGTRNLYREMARRLSVRYGRDFTANNVGVRLYRYDREVAEGKREPFQFSLTQSDALSTPDQIATALSRELGADWKALSDAGLIEIVARASDIGVPEGIPAAYSRAQRRAYLVAENMDPAQARALVLHEIGVHHGMEDMLGKTGWREVLRQVDALATSNPEVARWKDIIDEAVAEGRVQQKDATHEILAHLIEERADLPLVQSILSRLRQWLIKTFGTTFGMRLTVDDLRALAVASLRRVAEQARRETAEFTPVGRMSEVMASQSARPAPPFYSAVERVVGESKTARASGEQWLATISKAPGVKKEELEWIGLPDFLRLQEGPIAREDVLAFVRENGVRVEETVLGGEGADPALQARLLPLIEERERIQRSLDWAVVRQGEAERRGERPKFTAEEAQQIRDGKARLKELADEILPLQQEIANKSRANQTRWSQYTLPGGENYREVLLRLPAPDVPVSYEVVQSRPDRWNLLANGKLVEAFGSEQAARAYADKLRAGERSNPIARDIASGGAFRSSHWNEPNVLAHVRFNERVDSNGRRTLFLEEVQSDWHQAGRERGYETPEREAERRWATEQANAELIPLRKRDEDLYNQIVGLVRSEPYARYLREALDVSNPGPADYYKAGMGMAGRTQVVNGRMPNGPLKEALASLMVERADNQTRILQVEARQRSASIRNTVPDAPFKDNRWAALVLKRMIRWAAENGFDQVSWIRGQHAVERFGIETVADRIEYDTNTPSGGYVRVFQNGTMRFGRDMTDSGLAEFIGKELADRLLAAPERSGVRELTGDGLKFGGEGMRAFYDKILPNIANDIGKKYGARVGETEVRTDGAELAEAGGVLSVRRITATGGREEFNFTPRERARAEAKLASFKPIMETVHTLPLTPELRAQAMDGMPLFSMGPRRALSMSDNEVLRWFGDRVQVTRNKYGNEEYRFRLNDKIKRRDVGIEFSHNGRGGFEAITTYWGRTERPSRLDRGPTQEEMQRGAKLLEGMVLATRAKIIYDNPPEIIFAGATEAHARAYEFILGDATAFQGYRPFRFDKVSSYFPETKTRFFAIVREDRVESFLNDPPQPDGPSNAFTAPVEIQRRVRSRGGPDWSGTAAGTDEGPLFSLGTRRDPVETTSYQNRLRAVEERLNADGILARTALGKTSEARSGDVNGRVERFRGQGGTGKPDASGQGDGDAGARPLRLPREVVADILSVSGLRIEKTRGKTGADHRVSIDLPNDLDPVVADVFHPERTLIEFSVTDGGFGARDINIKWSHAADPIRGSKAGRWLYRQFVEWAIEHGYRVHSDIILSPMSVRIYESLQRQGFEVVRDHTAYLDEDGWTRTRNKQPVFRVKAGEADASAEILLSAPPPKGGWQIDGPTLKDRLAPMVEAQARRDAYDALSPAEQAMADNPDMLFSLPGSRRENAIKAQELMARILEEKRQAAEMRKGFEAAARCAARHGAGAPARGVQYGVGVMSDAWVGQVLGLAAAVPVGMTVAPIIARDARRYATPDSPLARQRDQAIEARFEAAREAGQMAGEAAGLDDPTNPDVAQGVPFSEAFDPNAQEGPAPEFELPGEQGGGYTDAGAKVPPPPAGFGEDA